MADALGKYNARQVAAHLPGYWGPQPGTSGPVYVGAAALLLAVLGLFVLRGRSKWWVAAVALLAVLLSWGNHFMGLTELFFRHFPMYNKFRTVSMILVIVEWCVPFLAAVVLQRIWCGRIEHARLMKGLKYSVLTVGGISLLFLLFGGALLSFSGGADSQMQLPDDVLAAMRDERASMMRADALRSLVFALLAAGAVWLFATDKIKRGALAAALAVIVTADMVPVNLRYLGRERFVPESAVRIRPTEADLQILADTVGEPGYRVLNLTVSPFNDASTSYFHRSVGGYHGAKLHRYQDLIEHHLSKMNWNVYDMLNTRYVIAPSDDGRGASVQRNDGANGAAWFVDEVRIVADPDEEIDALDSVDTKRVAVVDKRFAGMLEGVSVTADSSASIRMTEYRVNRHTYEYSAAAEGVAVFSEIYYPHGWTAYVDGQEAPYFRADYVLRAMKLPAGDHVVEFRFRAPHYETLTVVTLVCSLLLLLSLAAAVGVAAVRKRKTEQTATENGCGQE